MTKHGLLVLATIILAGLPAASRATDGDRSMREMRREAAHRTRRIIFNNDGNDAVYQCDEATREELLSKRTTPLADSQVDTIFYCPWSSGFGQFTMRSDVAELFDTTDRIFAKNITGALVEQGTDPLQIMVEWCREHEVEIFWSMRMNDVHDGAISDGQLYYPELFPQFKRDHPEYLIGEQGQRFPGLGSGRCWSGVNYAEQAVRDRAFAIIEDVCNRYDLDGIELDFFRHLIFFRNHATEGAASRQDLEKMTNLLRRVRRMGDEVGAARGRPILISVRVPDSVELCERVGLNIQRWLADDLVDMMTVSGYFRLRPWSESVALGRRYGVPVYAGLSESRVGDDEARRARMTPQAYRARAMNAWQDGCSGIYLFNFFNPNSSIWHELGERDELRTMDKAYFAAVRGPRAISGWLAGGEQYSEIPTLCPDRPKELHLGEAAATRIEIGEDLAAAEPEPEVTLSVQITGLQEPGDVEVELNGQQVTGGVRDEDWLRFTPQHELFAVGYNDVEVTLRAEREPAPVWRDLRVDVNYP